MKTTDKINWNKLIALRARRARRMALNDARKAMCISCRVGNIPTPDDSKSSGKSWRHGVDVMSSWAIPCDAGPINDILENEKARRGGK